MDLYKELLIKALEKQKLEVTFPDLKIDAEKIVEMKCYDALEQIKFVLNNDKLDDKECIEKIERIICVFENTCGSSITRHDF